MATFREAREALLFAYQDGSIDDTEFDLLYDLNSSENLEFPYWKYGRFDLDSMTDDECKAEFRFFQERYLFTRRSSWYSRHNEMPQWRSHYSFSKGYTAIDLHCGHYNTTGKEEKS